jgi:uncharacterized membrane protein (DUF485 family)
MKSVDNQSNDKRQYAVNLTLAGIAGMAGVITLVIILVAMFAGIWLDKKLDSNHGFTIGFILASVPLTLVIMLSYVKAATSRIKPEQKQIKTLEEERK